MMKWYPVLRLRLKTIDTLNNLLEVKAKIKTTTFLLLFLFFSGNFLGSSRRKSLFWEMEQHDSFLESSLRPLYTDGHDIHHEGYGKVK